MPAVIRPRRRRAIVASAVVGALLALAAPASPASATTIPPSTRHAPYSYLAAQPRNAKAPVRWDPCTLHRYKIVSGGTNATVRASLRVAVARLSKASGIPLVYAGITSVMPRRANAGTLPPAAGADIVLAFARPGSGRGRTDLLPSTNTLLGVGGAYYTWVGKKPAWFVSGYGLFDVRRVPRTAAGRTRMFEHEVGHALGLGHVGLRSDVMYPVQSSASATWSTGFAHGLLAIGRPAGCRT